MSSTCAVAATKATEVSAWALAQQLLHLPPAPLLDSNPAGPPSYVRGNQRGKFKHPRVLAIVKFYYARRKLDSWYHYKDLKALLPDVLRAYRGSKISTDLTNLHLSNILIRRDNPQYRCKTHPKWFYKFNTEYDISTLDFISGENNRE